MAYPFFGYNPNANDSSTKEEKGREKEFENSIGNLLVAEYQCYRLRERIKNHLSGTTDELKSEFMFKIDNTWFRINISAQKQEEKKQEKEEEKQQQSTGFAIHSYVPEHVAAAIIDDEEPNEEHIAMP